MVRARLARAVTRIAMANSDITNVAAPDVARHAAAIVKQRVSQVLNAARRATDATPSQARIIAVMARADALAAAAASRIVDAHVRLAIAQAIEKDSHTAMAARLAAADQLENAVALARETEAAASWATAAGAEQNIEALYEATQRAESQAYLGAAWTQSAMSWAYAAWALGPGTDGRRRGSGGSRHRH